VSKHSAPSKSTSSRRVDVNFDATQSRFAVFFESGPGEGSLTNGIKLSDILSNGEKSSPKHTLSSSGNVAFDVLANGDISIIGQNVISTLGTVKKESETSPKEPQKQDTENMRADEVAVERLQRISKSLDITGDLNVWISWMSSLNQN
jgi:hypothetical protein